MSLSRPLPVSVCTSVCLPLALSLSHRITPPRKGGRGREDGRTPGRSHPGSAQLPPASGLGLAALPPGVQPLPPPPLPLTLRPPSAPPLRGALSDPLFNLGARSLCSWDRGGFCICSAHLSFWTVRALSQAAPQQIFLTPEPLAPNQGQAYSRCSMETC